MLTPTEIHNDAALYEDITDLVADWIVTARKQFHTDELLARSPPQPGGLGNESITYETAVEMAGAFYDMQIKKNFDEMDFTQTTSLAPILQRPFQINPRKLMGAENSGVDLIARNIAGALYNVMVQEQVLVFKGFAHDGTNIDHNGVYNAAGSTYATTADFDTAGKPTLAVSSGLAEVRDYYEGPMNLFLNKTQYAELQGNLTSGDGPEWDIVMALLDGGNIYQCGDITAATGLLAPPPNPEFGEYVMLENYNYRFDQVSGGLGDMNPYRGYSTVCGLPFLKQKYLYCTLSSI